MATRTSDNRKSPASRGAPQGGGRNRPKSTGPAPRRPVPGGAPPKEPPEKKRVYSPRRHKYRKVKIGILYTLMVLAILAAGIAIAVTVLFKIDTVNVVGESRYEIQEIIRLSGVQKGDNLVLIDTKSGEEAIINAMPYLESVDIRRKIPSTINIEIKEATPAGAVSFSGGSAVINGAGKVLEVAPQPPEGVPVIKGAAVKVAEPSKQIIFEKETVQALIGDIEAARTEAGLSPVTEIDVTDLVNPTITYDGRIVIKLGTPTDLTYKLQTAVAVLNDGSMVTAERGALDVSLAMEKGRSYFKAETGAASEASSASEPPAEEPVPAPEPEPEPESGQGPPDTPPQDDVPQDEPPPADNGGNGDEPSSDAPQDNGEGGPEGTAQEEQQPTGEENTQNTEPQE